MSGIISCFVKHYNIWFDRRQLDTHICALSLLWYHIACNFCKTPLYTLERIRV